MEKFYKWPWLCLSLSILPALIFVTAKLFCHLKLILFGPTRKHDLFHKKGNMVSCTKKVTWSVLLLPAPIEVTFFAFILLKEVCNQPKNLRNILCLIWCLTKHIFRKIFYSQTKGSLTCQRVRPISVVSNTPLKWKIFSS